MTRFRLTARKCATAMLLALAALAIGAVFGRAQGSTAAVAAAPSNTATPVITGSAEPGSTLTASTGSWSGTAPFTFAYQWTRCDQNGNGCSAISSATGGSYAAQNADSGSTIRVTVTATNADGPSQSTSAATPPIGTPANTAAPTISGTTQQGQTLTTSNGTWNGTAPIAFAYQWSRCDQNDNSCAAISGATSQSYQLQNVDIGNTLQSTVTGSNTVGSQKAQSSATGVVTITPPVTGCPSGSGAIQIGDLQPPARLAIDQQTVTPGVVTPSTQTIQLHFRVTACSGRPVQGALVYETAVPYNQYSIPPEGTTAADGTVNLNMNQETGFPAARNQELLVVFVRASKPGEPITSGVSTRLLVSFPVSLKQQ